MTVNLTTLLGYPSSSSGGAYSTLDAVDWLIQPAAAAFIFNGTTLDLSTTNPVVGAFISGGDATPTAGQTVYLNDGIAAHEGIYVLGSVGTPSAIPITRISGWPSGRTLYEGQEISGRYGNQWDGQYIPSWSTLAILPSVQTYGVNTSTGEISINGLSSIVTGGSINAIPAGWPVKFTVAPGGTMPAPLVSGTVYYSLGPGTNGFTTLSATSGGSQITLTSTGSNGTFNSNSLVCTVTYAIPLVYHTVRFILTLASQDVANPNSNVSSWILGTTCSNVRCRAEALSTFINGYGQTTIGNGAYSTGAGIAIGYNTQASGGVALGYQANNSGSGFQGVAIGQSAFAGWYGLAIGMNATNNYSLINGVALGYNSSSIWANSVAYTNDGYLLSSSANPFRHTIFLNGPATSGTGTTVLVTDVAIAYFTSSNLIVPAYTRFYFEGTVTATEQTSGNSVVWKVSGYASQGATAASTAVQVLSIQRIFYTSGVSTASLAITADTTNGILQIQGTGSTGLTLTWGGCLNIDISSTGSAAPAAITLDSSALPPTVYKGTATVNFGTANNTAVVAVTGQTGFVNTMQVEAWLAPVANSTNLEDDYIVTPFSVAVPASLMVNGTGFTIIVKCHQGMAHGQFNINWRYQ